MRTTAGSRGGRRAGVLACGVLLCALAAGCAQAVPGTPHPEGESPATAGGPSAGAAPPTEFREPSGRPTVTVEPDQTEPLVPGPLSTAPSSPPPSSPAPSSPAPSSPAPSSPPPPSPPPPSPTPSARSAPAPAAPGRPPSPTGDRRSAPLAAAPAAPDRPRRTGGAAAPAAPTAPETTLLTADVLDDECLLDARGFAALLGGPVGKPAEAAVIRPDGSSTRSCYAASRAGDPAPTAAVNVYRVNRGTPASFVRAAAGGRPLPGVGEAAVLLDTLGGTTLQVATSRYLVTVNVVDASPSTERWAAAGKAAAAAVGRP